MPPRLRPGQRLAGPRAAPAGRGLGTGSTAAGSSTPDLLSRVRRVPRKTPICQSGYSSHSSHRRRTWPDGACRAWTRANGTQTSTT